MIHRILIIGLTFWCMVTQCTKTSSFQKGSFFADKQLAMLKQQAHTWAFHTNLTPVELQMMANILYLSHATALYDVQMRTNAHSAFILAWSLTGNRINNNTTALKRITLLQNVVSTTKKIVVQHRHYKRQWDILTRYLETTYDKETPFMQSLECAKKHIQQALTDYLQQKNQKMIHAFQDAQQTLTTAGQVCENIATMYQELGQGTLDLQVDAQDERAAQLHVANKLADAVEASSFKNMQKTHLFMQEMITLEKISTTLFALYYTKLYQAMEQRNLTKQYFFGVVGKKGLLPPIQQKKPLPLPSDLDTFVE